jgi:hypothetical protein
MTKMTMGNRTVAPSVSMAALRPVRKASILSVSSREYVRGLRRGTFVDYDIRKFAVKGARLLRAAYPGKLPDNRCGSTPRGRGQAADRALISF